MKIVNNTLVRVKVIKPFTMEDNLFLINDILWLQSEGGKNTYWIKVFKEYPRAYLCTIDQPHFCLDNFIEFPL